ncbi:hypothetical protein BJ741DRAFT_646773 [Chytriomyces cf. hyalinus JEL632]|nr:hypothetical protein BJ741DRAFT_646773 [Chytriomyces cf. hyalinus JEL632]
MASTLALNTTSQPTNPLSSQISKEAQNDWLAWMDQEEGENLASAIVESVIARGQEVLFEKHIESQVLPYAVGFAKGTLLKIVEWQFFRRDSGEIKPETWLADEGGTYFNTHTYTTTTEPKPAVIDSWARGAIPVKKRPVSMAHVQQKLTSEVERSLRQSVFSNSDDNLVQSSEGYGGLSLGSAGIGGGTEKRTSAASLTSNSRKVMCFSSVPEKDSLTRLHIQSKSQNLGHAASGSRILQKSGSAALAGAPANVRRGMLEVNEEGPISAAVAAERAIVLENKKTAAKIQTLEREGVKTEVGYDADGRLLLVKRAGANRLLTQGVKATIAKPDPLQPVAPATQKGSRKPPTFTNAIKQKSVTRKPRAHLPVGADSQLTISRTTVGLLSQSSLASAVVHEVGGRQNNGIAGTGFVPDTTLDIPSLAETMRLAPGVTLRQGDVVKKGPSRKLQQRMNAESTPKLNEGTQDSGYILATSSFKSQSSKHTVRRGTSTTSAAPDDDPVLKSVLSKAKPTLRPIPFPTLGLRGEDAGDSNQVYPKLPDIKGEERRVEAQ